MIGCKLTQLVGCHDILRQTLPDVSGAIGFEMQGPLIDNTKRRALELEEVRSDSDLTIHRKMCN